MCSVVTQCTLGVPYTQADCTIWQHRDLSIKRVHCITGLITLMNHGVNVIISYTTTLQRVDLDAIFLLYDHHEERG